MEGGVRVLYVGPDSDSATDLDAVPEIDAVVAASRASEVESVLAEREPDCVACEDRLPDASAIEVLRTVRNVDPAVPFVLYAFDGSEALAAEAISDDVTDYVRAGDAKASEELADSLLAAVRRYHAEQDVAMLNELARTVYERITDVDAFIALDREWRITHVNRAAEDLLCVPAARLDEELLWEAFPSVVDTPLAETLRRAVDTQERVRSVEIFEPLGERVEVRAVPSEEGLSVHLRSSVGNEPTDTEHLVELTSVLAHDLVTSIESARSSLASTRAANPEVEGLDDVEAALDRMDAVVNHTIALANGSEDATE